VNKVIIGLVIAVIVLSGAVSFLAYSSQDNIDATFTEITNTVIPYKYNTVCDLGDMKTFWIEKVLFTHLEIMDGKHNDNAELIKFFKEDTLLAITNTTPDQVFTPENKKYLGPPLTDPMYFLPVILQIIDTNPKLIEILTVHEGDTELSYLLRLELERKKCE